MYEKEIKASKYDYHLNNIHFNENCLHSFIDNNRECYSCGNKV